MASKVGSTICTAAVVCALIFVALRPAAADKTPVTLPGWSTAGQPGGWVLSDPTQVTIVRNAGEVPYVEVAVPSTSPSLWGAAQLDLPLAAIKGTVIEVSVDVRAKNVTKPAHDYNGVKAMVHVVNPGHDDTWDQAQAGGDTFPLTYDWKTLTFQTTVPQSTTTATIMLGLQESSGAADFRNLTVSVVQKAQ